MKATMTRAERIQALTDLYGYICFHPDCRKPFKSDDEITFDHWWVPQSMGGEWTLENLRLMHKRCNALKGDRIPNPDGTLPPLKRELKSEAKALAKSERPEICDTCMSGRILLIGETCEVCGSGPQPAIAPRAMQVKPKECDHATTHCWVCFLGFVPRKAAILTVLDAEYLDE